MRPAHLTFASLLLACAGCASSASLPAPTTASASPEASASGEAAPDTAPSAGAALTAAGAPELAAPTTPRVAQTGDAASRCARIAGLCLEDVERMMGFLGATDEQSRAAVDGLRPAYGAGFTDRCATATPEMLTCVETAENALTGLARCGINRGRTFSDVLICGESPGFEVRWAPDERAVTDAPGADALRAAMVGSWSHRDRGTWTLTAEGRATLTQTVAGAPVVGAYQFTATSRARIVSDPFGFWSAVVDGDVLYLHGTAGGVGYSVAQPIDEDGWTIAIHNGFWAIRDLRGTPRCTGFSWWGQPVQTAECTWEGEGDARRLRIMAGFGHDLLSGEAAEPSPVRFRELSGHLVGNNDLRFFRRVP
jgi:hypothetical protein